MKTYTCPFRPGERLRCVDPTGRLRMGEIYHVTDTADIGPPTALVTLREVPCVLFHPDRFVKSPS